MPAEELFGLGALTGGKSRNLRGHEADYPLPLEGLVTELSSMLLCCPSSVLGSSRLAHGDPAKICEKLQCPKR